ncbi:beta-ketoacyl-[acyl-carrier-protein] synthase family protein [Microbacterium azadirachtae]|uniref:beta-ketoacyl-[acyl-carrier-protein] synthase family protein n=1 Tax=Microbacterium azadirachtae TaxID=582680 RepID=UPI00088E192F|nr:beta-ketoacyl-[acyl-carrier-protein] synthase family protein [Microbacterium azadirachtae]UXW86204.1 beta-ketoacyl-[acyl-carrier-protein] synthase family protein [Microbacterium azadirachtae]SDL60363.1 3-oxoacyl-[acyl-carrier-protein] synthase II [Microbacterium azadirachtae]SEF89282.1 3-oxoacyl-[acyl-carrier-protein] synthase II [Microbacterium azadirachtae]SEF91225.1 3-oxoacyl-[acyl-carrier-protein] synthase II [Microbacterium azadirachtae]
MSGIDVVVTGLGAITPLGGDVRSTWEALLDGRSGIRGDVLAGTEDPVLSGVAAGTMAVDPAGLLPAVQARRLDRSQQAALAAAAEAWADAGAPVVDPERLAAAVGTGIGGVGTLLSEDDVRERSGARRVSPRTVPMLMPNAAAALLSIAYGARAGSYTPVSACSSGAEAIALGARLIRAGEADVVIAGGTEAAITPLTIAGFRQARSLSHHAGDPASASRPFASDRSGFVLAEGAAILVLESARHAAARGARVHAVVAGAGIAADAHHLTAPAPDGSGQASAMRKALAQARLSPAEIAHVNAHATGTSVGDAAESRAIREVFGRVPVTAPKASLGHLFGAAGAIEALIAVLSVEHGVIPPTRNLTPETVDPEIGLDVVTDRREAPQGAVLSNSFGFGGQNVSLVVAAASA